MISKLYGLILSGGKSTRMGTDKGMINYHGQPQRDYLFNLANKFCDKVYFSIRDNQQEEFTTKPYLIDEDKYKGPFNGILSAHAKHNNVAWLVLACDLPLLNAATIEKLVNARNANKNATAFATHQTKLPEPLIAIWEPHGLLMAEKYMQTAKSSCARKFLINTDIDLVYPTEDKYLYNANSLAEYEEATKLLGN